MILSFTFRNMKSELELYCEALFFLEETSFHFAEQCHSVIEKWHRFLHLRINEFRVRQKWNLFRNRMFRLCMKSNEKYISRCHKDFLGKYGTEFKMLILIFWNHAFDIWPPTESTSFIPSFPHYRSRKSVFFYRYTEH